MELDHAAALMQRITLPHERPEGRPGAGCGCCSIALRLLHSLGRQVHSHEGLRCFPLADGTQGLARGQPLIYALDVESVLAGQHAQLVAVPGAAGSWWACVSFWVRIGLWNSSSRLQVRSKHGKYSVQRAGCQLNVYMPTSGQEYMAERTDLNRGHARGRADSIRRKSLKSQRPRLHYKEQANSLNQGQWPHAS